MKHPLFSSIALGLVATATLAGQAQVTAASQSASSTPAAQSAKAKTTDTVAKPKVAKMRPAMRPAAPAAPSKPPWEEFKLDPKTTMLLDFSDSDPDQVVSLFARTSGVTILKDPSFKTPLTFTSAKAVSLDDAFSILNEVLKMNGFELQKRGKMLVVAKPQPPAPPPPPPAPQGPPVNADEPIVKVYPLIYASATQVSRVVNEVFSQQQLEAIVQQLQSGGGFPQGGPMPGRFGPGGPQGNQPPKIVRASAEDYTNSVIVNAPKKYQEEVQDLIKQLDKSTQQALVSEVFKLQYVTVGEVVDAIQDVLTANTPTGRGVGKPQDQNQNFFYYNPFRSNNNQKTAGGQSVIALKQTNSVIVSATDENMEIVRKLIKNLDQPATFVGTTFVMHLENAKAEEVATLLNQAFTPPKNQNQNDNPFFFIYSDNPPDEQKDKTPTDHNDKGEIVNVRDLTGKVNVIADKNTNSLIVVTVPSNIPLVKKIVDDIDKTSEQVMIETVIVEANLDKTDRLGVEWNFTQTGPTGHGTSATGSTNFGLQSSTTPLQGLGYTLTGETYKAFLNAITTDNRNKVLSTPRIFTSNNVKAEINVSTKLPYINNTQEGALGTLFNSYDFLDVGVILDVTPRVTASGQVTMDVVQSADDLQGYTSFNAPIVNHRSATTTVTVDDGATIVLGGIIGTTKTRTENKVPLLGDIPFLGNLFKSGSNEVQKTELMVLLTPHIVHTPDDARRLRDIQTKELSKDSQGELKNVVKPGGGN